MMHTNSAMYRVALLLASKERNRRAAASCLRTIASSTTTTSNDEPPAASASAPSASAPSSPTARRNRNGNLPSPRPRVDSLRRESFVQGAAAGSEALPPRHHHQSTKNSHRKVLPLPSQHEDADADAPRTGHRRAPPPDLRPPAPDPSSGRRKVGGPPPLPPGPAAVVGTTSRDDDEGGIAAPPKKKGERQSSQGLLRDLAGRLVRMQGELDRFGPIPPIWELGSRDHGHDDNDDDANDLRRGPTAASREAAAEQAIAELRRWVADLRDAVEGHDSRSAKTTRLSKFKHRNKLIVLLERSMRVCEDAASPARPGAHDLCRELLDLMTKWGLNWQQRHVDSAIAAAARSGRWAGAAQHFEAQIDPDRGNCPVDVSLAEPVGLYALARHWQQQRHDSEPPGTIASEAPPPTVVERVMAAVNRMSMLSPTDQESYVLAAGTALGRAGEWHDLVYYLRNNPKAEELGQPLIAAAMHACILCDRHEEALWLYDEYVVSHDAVLASDWQWAGGDTARLNPLCRDLAMRAMGGAARSGGTGDNSGFAARALECYWNAMGDGVTVSLEALGGVADACRNEGRWEDAMSVLFSVLTKSFHARWLVPGNTLAIAQVDDKIIFDPEILPKMGPFVGTVLAACNDAGHFATSVLALSLLQLSLSSNLPMVQVSLTQNLPESLLPVIDLLHGDRDLVLAALMEALVGLQCSRESLMLYESVNARDSPVALQKSWVLYDSIHQTTENVPTTSIWPTTFAKVHRFMVSFKSFVDDEAALPDDQAKHLSFALASLVALCTGKSQAQAGLALATWVDLHTPSSDSILPMTDSLVGSLIDAHTHCGNYDVAMNLFNSAKTDSKPKGQLLSSVAAVKSMFKHSRTSEAVSLFETVVKDSHSPDLMSAVASGLLRAGEWNAAFDLYRLAMSKGCLSEEICLLAIKAVSAGRVDGRFRIMRNIIEDVSSLSGIAPNDWIELKYWDLKRLIGFAETARLMWWSDPQTRSTYELNFALECLEKRKLDGLTPKNDALRLIASASKSYRSFLVPDGGPNLSLLPRCASDWKRVLNHTLEEARHSSLFTSRAFIESVAIGYAELGSFEDATRIIDDAVDRGVDVERSVLYFASHSTAAGS